MDDASAMRRGDGLCAVGAARIDYELLLRKRNAVQAAPDYLSFVTSDYEQRDGKFLRRRHCGSFTQPSRRGKGSNRYQAMRESVYQADLKTRRTADLSRSGRPRQRLTCASRSCAGSVSNSNSAHWRKVASVVNATARRRELSTIAW